LLLAGVSTTLIVVSGAGTTGSLVVESDPPGASVFLDGRPAGQTPLTVPTIEVGVHRVRVMRLGYLENSRLITIKRGERTTVHARLTDPAPQTATAAALKIVVLEGEGAVNIIQQKTAVAPVVEVRDRNDQPVAGAIVRFAIQKGKATFDGARTMSVTTNAAGRAMATGLTATGKGAVQIAASVAFQGETAAVTVAQTNVLTAAEAATAAGAGGAGGSGGGASGAGGGGGGGLSATTIGIIGGAAAAGAIVLKKTVLGGLTHYIGQYSGILSQTRLDQPGTCVIDSRRSGDLLMRVEVSDNGTVNGNAGLSGTSQEVNRTAACGPPSSVTSFDVKCCGENSRPPVTGTTSTLGFTFTRESGGTTETFSFTGAFVGEQIVGTFTESVRFVGPPPSVPFGGSASYPVTLRVE
jgi:hypothetical protein